MKTIGILGGGQLGGMLSESLLKYGAKVAFYDPEPTSPSFHRSPLHFQGSWNDFEKLKEFFSLCDLITYEFENVSTELLESLVKVTGKKIYPSASVLAVTQNRFYEKTFLKENNIPVCQFAFAKSYEDLIQILPTFPKPFIIKTSTGGYDGKGQWSIENEIDISNFITDFTKDKFVEVIVEEKIAIEYEASCIVARNQEGDSLCFPIFDNVHKDHILYNTTIPSMLNKNIQNKLKEIAKNCANKLNIVGLLTTEFFITKQKNKNNSQNETDGYSIFVNEFAPRPHNSGHISRNACDISQYDAHARALLDLPLHEPKLNPGFYCMGNLLGNIWFAQGNKDNLNLSCWKNHPEIIDVYLYGKEEAKLNRKMGHFISYSNKSQEHINAAERFRKDLNEKQS